MPGQAMRAHPTPALRRGPSPGTIMFGTKGPWPVANVEYGYADGIQEAPVVGVSTDEPVLQADGGVCRRISGSPRIGRSTW